MGGWVGVGVCEFTLGFGVWSLKARSCSVGGKNEWVWAI